jgi:hypothetical protein
LMTRFIKPGLGPRVQQPGLRVCRPFETGPSLPPPSRLVPLEPRPMAIRSYGKGPSPGTEPVRTYASSPEERSNSSEIGLLRGKIQKADEGRSNTEDEILLLERRVESQITHGCVPEDHVENNDELREIRKKISDQAVLEDEILEMSQEVWGSEFYARREQEWNRWRRGANVRLTQVREANWTSQSQVPTRLHREEFRPRAHTVGAHLLEKVKMPVFNGKVEDWADF